MDFTNILVSLFTLTILEVILGVDNLVFLSITSSRLPLAQQKTARRLGLLFALFTRLIFLASVVWIIGLTKPLFTIMQQSFSVRDLFLILGGLFLLYKATVEIHHEFESSTPEKTQAKYSSFLAVVTQIVILDIIFSLDSILTAIGLTQHYFVMATAIIIAIILMIICSEPLSRFINAHPTVRMLALSFLLLIGVVLVADGFHYHIPRAYIYCSICFSLLVEVLNMLRQRKMQKKS
ncbi:MAG TPA: TerC family protein [Gammaproteobacteria bacterium]|nr:TerC family protein [Gammaproteobacteria bacterium]